MLVVTTENLDAKSISVCEEKNYFAKKPLADLMSLHDRKPEFRINIQQWYAAPNNKNNNVNEGVNKLSPKG